MASYSVATSKAATLTAATVDTVTVTGNKRGFRIQHRGAVGTPDIWYTWGYTTPSDPATDGSVDGSYNLAANSVDRLDDPVSRDNEAQVVIKLISTGAVAYSVETW